MKNKPGLSGFGFAVVIVIAMLGLYLWKGRSTPTPGYFNTGVTLQEALARSEQSGRPVLAVVTADWCPPCRELKRGALSDERVARWIEANTEAVYVDVTDRDNADAGVLGVRQIPALIMLDDRGEVARSIGPMSSGEFLSWAERSVP